jgi:DNA-binding NarL/FixJ family response regulator
MIRVVVADDHDLIRGGLAAILEAEPDIEVVAQAGDGAAAVAAATAHRADVVLMDLQMPGVDGIEGTRRLATARPQCRVLVLTMFDLDEYISASLRAGAAGFLLKTTPPAELANAIRACHAGEVPMARTVTRRMVEAYLRRPRGSGTPPDAVRGLTDRELAVLRALARGQSNAEIAAELYLGEATVKTHVSHILAKLHLRDRGQAIAFAYECGLVAPSER